MLHSHSHTRGAERRNVLAQWARGGVRSRVVMVGSWVAGWSMRGGRHMVSQYHDSAVEPRALPNLVTVLTFTVRAYSRHAGNFTEATTPPSGSFVHLNFK